MWWWQTYVTRLLPVCYMLCVSRSTCSCTPANYSATSAAAINCHQGGVGNGFSGFEYAKGPPLRAPPMSGAICGCGHIDAVHDSNGVSSSRNSSSVSSYMCEKVRCRNKIVKKRTRWCV